MAKKAIAVVDDTAIREKQSEVLNNIGHTLEAMKRKAVTHKTQIEFRMQLDNDQYWGLTGSATTKKDVTAGFTGHRHGGVPIDNKTRSMTRIASARIGDMLFPTNSPNWALKPTPYPEVPDQEIVAEYQLEMQANPPQPDPQTGEQPEPPPIDAEALSMKIATRACRKMTRKISDCLAESAYAEQGRAAILDACRVGTGIIKGPYMKRTVRKTYQNVDGVSVMDAKVVTRPAVARVDPWMFFPQHARSIEEAEYAFELHMFTGTKVRQMVMTHGFYPDQVNKLLRESPDRGNVDMMLRRRSSLLTDADNYDEQYAMWEYHGPIERDALETLGISVPAEDNLTAYTTEIWFCQGQVCRVSLSPLEADTELLYHVFNYEEDESSVFGYGVPYIMRDDQAVIDMMWASMIHNAAVTAGPQMAIKKGMVVPADGSYVIAGPKLWYLNDEDMPIQEAIQSFVIDSTISTNMPLYTQAKENADSNTNLPMMVGDAQAAQIQGGASGMAQIYNAQNIVQRQAAHNWDDHITARLIGRTYDWYMQHDKDTSIKGDYDVEVRGASYLLIKDQQAQHAQLLVQMTSQDQELAAIVKKDELYRIYVGFMDIPTEQLIRTPDEQASWTAAQQPDPVAQAEAGKIAGETEKIAAETRKIDAETAKLGGAVDPETGQPMPEPAEPMSEEAFMKLNLEYAKLQQKESEGDKGIQIELIRRDTTMMKVSAANDVAYEKLSHDANESETARTFNAMIKQTDDARDDYFKSATLRLEAYRVRLQAKDSARGFDSGA